MYIYMYMHIYYIFLQNVITFIFTNIKKAYCNKQKWTENVSTIRVRRYILMRERLECSSYILLCIDSILITSEQSEQSFFWIYMPEVSGNLTRTASAWTEPDRIGPTVPFLWDLYLGNYESHHFETQTKRFAFF